jgi:hypothetical protein
MDQLGAQSDNGIPNIGLSVGIALVAKDNDKGIVINQAVFHRPEPANGAAMKNHLGASFGDGVGASIDLPTVSIDTLTNCMVNMLQNCLLTEAKRNFVSV